MKLLKVLSVMSLILGSISVFAGAGALDGRSYCRTITNTTAIPGRPIGTSYKHCVSFEEGNAIDNADGFFGNPYKLLPYKVVNQTISFGTSAYLISSDGVALVTITGSAVAGTILSLQK